VNIATALRTNGISVFVPIYVTGIKHLIPTAAAIFFFYFLNVLAIPIFIGAVLKPVGTTRARPIVLVLIFPVMVRPKLHRIGF
jgi:hypothetical protein